MTKAIAAAFLFVSTLFAEPSLLRHFDYDQKSPLDTRNSHSRRRLPRSNALNG